MLDELAQALILLDAREESSVAELAAAAEALCAWARTRPAVRPAAEAMAEAARAAFGGCPPEGWAEDLERRFGELDRAVRTVAGKPKAQPAPRNADAAAAVPWVCEPPAPEPSPLAGDAELLRDFVARAGEHLEAADEALLTLEREPSDADSLNAAFRAFHTIKGMAGFLGLTEVERTAHDAESLLDDARKRTGVLTPDSLNAVFGAVDTMRSLVSKVLTSVEAVAAPASLPPVVPSAAASVRAAPPSVRSAAPATVRVDEERLDRLLDMIGELVIAEAVFSGAAWTDEAFADLAVQLGRLDKITRELQEMATSLRMVPLRSTFRRMARLVRDTAQRAGKQVEFVTSGEDTELDKLVVDRISDPLIHLLRNAVDHGVEDAEARRAAGKPAAGRVELRAFHGGGRIHIEVVDDGGGLDPEAILAAARSRGEVSDHERPSDREIGELVFLPGLSTSAEVTDVSGRGVGMDVVKRTIEGLRGDIVVDSTLGRGTRIEVRLPLTLAIIDGMVVSVGDERYIVPTLSIERSLRPESAQVSTVLDRGAVIRVGDELVPLVQLARLFDTDGAEQDPTRGIVVVVSENGDKLGLVADGILGQQQIVIKSLGEGMRDTRGVAGGAIMPDGRVGLIVDVGGLVELARS